MKAKFITLEGIEGSGKTSSLKSITDLLDKKNISYVVTREPGGSSIGKELRAILLDPETEISPEVELMLMLSDRIDHVEKIILPLLITISEDLKKSVPWLCVVLSVFTDQTISPLFTFALIKSPDEVEAITWP